MNDRIREFIITHLDFLVYCVFGAMATAVNMLGYELLYAHIGLANTISVALMIPCLFFLPLTRKTMKLLVKNAKVTARNHESATEIVFASPIWAYSSS